MHHSEIVFHSTVKPFTGDGDVHELPTFLLELEGRFEQGNIRTDPEKISLLILHLGGRAARWFVKYRREYDVKMMTYEEVVGHLRNRFGQDSNAMVILARLMEVSQNGTLAEYNDEFCSLLCKLPAEWVPPDHMLVALYWRGLKPRYSIAILQAEAMDLSDAMRITAMNSTLNKDELYGDSPRLQNPRDMGWSPVGLEEDTFEELPLWIQERYLDTVKDDLPSYEFNNCSVEHAIEFKEHSEEPRARAYKLKCRLEKVAVELIQDLLDKGFIVPSKSTCTSQLTLVKEKDATYHIAIDYRRVNNITVKDPFPLPTVESLLARVGTAGHFTILNLHNGQFQIPLREEDRYKTAFITTMGTFEFTVMPEGLLNGPNTFAKYMADVVGDLPFVFVYMGDVLIFSDTEEEHWTHIDAVLSRLAEKKLVSRRSDSHFNQEEFEYLGYVISRNSIEPARDRIESINHYPKPKCVKDAQRFLSMINYYRRFIPNFAMLVKPILQYACRKTIWWEDQEKAFDKVKRLLRTGPVLVPYKEGASYRLTTEASKNGVAAVLEEVAGNDTVGVVGYFSKLLKGAQRHYPEGELELLAIVEALRHFRYILQKIPFTLRADHINLALLQDQSGPVRRISAWFEELSEYDFTLEYYLEQSAS
ncbi:AaceriAGL178Wp [[Ashbya] aceris (nom. inval.)]|nr:AaceriAGL178Wp [[Ashbya] aceris (nom. inval.)]